MSVFYTETRRRQDIYLTASLDGLSCLLACHLQLSGDCAFSLSGRSNSNAFRAEHAELCQFPTAAVTSSKYRLLFKFKVCKSVHPRTIQINYQPDTTILQFIILTFIYSSTCFGRFSYHYQELNDCSSSLWLYLRIVATAVLCSWSGRPKNCCI